MRVSIDRILDEELRLAVVHRHRPESIDWRELSLGKCHRVIVLTPVEVLAIGQRLGHRIHSLDGVVAVDASLGGGGPLQPIAIEEGAVTKERTDLPAVDVLLSSGAILL